MKKCSKCGKRRNISKFEKREDSKDGRRAQCKKCHIRSTKEWMEQYRKKNKKRILERYKIYYRKNKIKKIKYSNEWRKNNREKFNKLNRQIKARQRKNPKIRLDHNISKIISSCLNGKKAGRQWETLVGYTLQDLTKHLEKQFDDKMNWENYGSYWHIDHRTPKSWFKYETAEDEEFKKCWSLENLQPLEAKANISKGNRYDVSNSPSPDIIS